MFFALFPLQVLIWTFRTKPYKRVKSLTEIRADFYTIQVPPPNQTYKQLAHDAFDLCCNLRGCGWNWSRNIYIPSETRPTNSTTAFVTATFASFTLYFLGSDLLYYLGQWLTPSLFTYPKGVSIFDPALPPLLRYLKSTAISFLMLFAVQCYWIFMYSIASVLGVLVFRQDPSLWPPAFDSPWQATSVADFWVVGGISSSERRQSPSEDIHSHSLRDVLVAF
jgi:hypothetical protein